MDNIFISARADASVYLNTQKQQQQQLLIRPINFVLSEERWLILHLKNEKLKHNGVEMSVSQD